MQAICFQDVESLQVQHVAEPQIEQEGDCIVQVELAGLCGSDLHPYWGRERGLDRGCIMGHEFVGRVVQRGSAVKHVEVGDRVFAPFSTNCGACYFCLHRLPSRCVHGQLFGWRSAGQGLDGGQAESVRVPWADATLLKLPEGLSLELALLLGDNLSTGYFCTELAEVQQRGVYAVLGCGNVGLMAIWAAKQKGCQSIVALDFVEQRRQQAERLGATVVASEQAAIETVLKLSQGRGADGVMELVGMNAAQALAYQLVRPGGTIATVGCHCDPHFAFSPSQAYDKNLTYRTGRCPARFYMQQLLDLPAVQEMDVRQFVTHYFALSDGPRAYELFSQRRDGIIKGVFDLR